MRISKLTISHFRGIKEAELFFDKHNLLVGKNNIGKSTICEAVDLVLGPDRLNRIDSINEYDFYNGDYIKKDGENPKIIISVFLIDMSEDLKSVFGSHLKFWHKSEKRVLGSGEIDEVDEESIEECLELKFIGKYDEDEDEFIAKTYYASTIDSSDEDLLDEVYKSKKRLIGFLYLRALRTGRRALSLERGSLLDILLRVGELRPKFWEETRNRLMDLEPPLDESIGSLRNVLEGIEDRIAQYIPLAQSESSTTLNVSRLTREHLRQTLAFFVKSSSSGTPIPFDRLGTGTLSTLVFAMLSAIAELKKENVIFAMEEPEISVPPHTQRRIIDYLLGSTNQAIVTSHSPYVIEKFDSKDIKILSRDDKLSLVANKVFDLGTIKSKTYRHKIRHSIAEAILGNSVIIGEGLSEVEILSIACSTMEKDTQYYPLDLSGVTIFDAGGDGQVVKFGKFFNAIGLKTYAFYDQLPKGTSKEQRDEYNEVFNIHFEIPYKGIEKLLISEIDVEIQWKFIQSLVNKGKLRFDIITTEKPNDAVIRNTLFKILKGNKGERYSADLLEKCKSSEVPISIRNFLEAIYLDNPRPSDLKPFSITSSNQADGDEEE